MMPMNNEDLRFIDAYKKDFGNMPKIKNNSLGLVGTAFSITFVNPLTGEETILNFESTKESI